MKRFFSLILCLTLLLSAAACGDGGRGPSGGSGGRTPSGSGHSAPGAASFAPTPTPTSAPAPEPTPEPTPTVPDGVLPDPYSFFFGDEEVKYKTSLERSYYIATFYFTPDKTGVEDDYIELIQGEPYNLVLRDTKVSVSSNSGSVYTSYIFDYAGAADIPNFDVNSNTDMALMITAYEWEKRVDLDFWYALDGFTFQDLGDRSSYGNLASACLELTTCRRSGGPLGPDKFGESGPSGGSGGNTGYCTRCGGTGKVRCTTCGGNGLVGYGYGGTGRCSACSGNGKVKCSACNGTGK